MARADSDGREPVALNANDERQAGTRIGSPHRNQGTGPETDGTERTLGIQADFRGTAESPTADDSNETTKVLGDYRLVRQIGQGGMGIVYEAMQLSLQKRVAVKVLPLTSVLHQRTVKRFQNEAWAAARLEHPHIVPVYFVGCDRGVHYYVMQLIEGGDLGYLLQELRKARHGADPAGSSPAEDASDDPWQRTPKKGQARPSRSDTAVSQELRTLVSQRGSTSHPAFLKAVVDIGVQAAEALEYAHQMGIVHRDIKPSNLMLDAQGKIWITDFGLAQIQNNPSMTATGDIVGTLRYMSPEQAFGKRVVVDHRTDIYSLGVTLYELLTLHAAFGPNSRETILRQIAFEEPLAPRKINRDIPIELETIVTKAMSKSPEDRYQSAGELADDLKRYRNNEPICGRRPNLRQRISRWSKRNPSTAAAAGVFSGVTFIAVVIVAIVFGYYYSATAALLESEQEQRGRVERLLEQSEGLRLAANASQQLSVNPGRSLVLATEGAKRFRSSETNEAILAAIDELHELKTFAEHQTSVGSVALSPDGTHAITTASRLLFGQKNEPARLWNLQTGDPAGVLQDEQTVTSAVFSPDHFRILTTASPVQLRATDDNDGSKISNHVHLWDSISKRKLVSFSDTFLFDAHQQAFDPQGRRIVLPAYGQVAKIFDCVGGHELRTLEGHDHRVVFAAFDPMGKRIATASDDQTVRLWDADTGAPLFTLDLWQQRTAGDASCTIDSLTFSPDGSQLATGSTRFGIHLWNTETGERINRDHWEGSLVRYRSDGQRILSMRTHMPTLQWHEAETGKWIRSIKDPVSPVENAVLSPDGRTVATYGGQRGIRLFDIASGELLTTLRGHEGNVSAAVYRGDGKELISASSDGTARRWSLQKGAERASFSTLAQSRGQATAAIDAGGKTIAIAGTPQYRGTRLTLETPLAAEGLPGRISSPDHSENRFLSTRENQLVVHDLATGAALAQYNHPTSDFSLTAISVAGDRVAFATKDGSLGLWHPDSDRLFPLATVSTRVHALQFDRAGEQLVAAGSDGAARLWDADSGELISVLRQDASVEFVEFSPDNRLLLMTTSQNRATIWETDSLARKTTLADSSVPFNRARFSHDGRHVVTSRSHNCKGVLCWNVESGEIIGRLDEAIGKVHVATSPVRDEAGIASDQAGTLLWDFAAGTHQVISPLPVADVRFSADGEQGVSVTASRSPRRSSARSDDSELAQPLLFQRWSRDDLETVETFPSSLGRVGAFSIAADGQILANAWQYGVSLHDIESTALTRTLVGHAAPLCFVEFLPDAKQLVTASQDGSAIVWDTVTGAPRLVLDAHAAAITTADVSADGRRLLTGASTGEMILWNIETGKPLHSFQLFDAQVLHVAVDPTGQRALLISSDGDFALYHLGDQREVIFPRHRQRVEWAEFSPDGEQLLLLPQPDVRGSSVSGNRPEAADSEPQQPATGASLFLITSQDLLSPIAIPGDLPHTAHFDPTGKQLVLLAKSGRVRIVEAATGHEIKGWQDPKSPHLAAAFSPDGKRIVTASFDKISVWDVDSTRLLFTLDRPGISPSRRHTFQPIEPSNRWIVGAFLDERFRRWPLDPLRHAQQVSPRSITADERAQFIVLSED